MNTPQDESPRFVTCHCQVCNGNIEFDATGFQKGETRAVECPFCKMETIIFVPPDFVLRKSSQGAAEKTFRVTPRTKFLLIAALAIIAISGVLFYLIKTDKMTPTSLGQILSGEESWSKSLVFQQGDLQIKVQDWTELGTVMTGSRSEPSSWAAYNHLFAMRVVLSNLSNTRKIDFASWRGEPFHFGRDYATLTDDNGNVYKRMNFEGKDLWADWNSENYKTETTIYPQSDFTDLLVFEPMVRNLKRLHLELPAENFGGSGMIRFEIPISETGWRMPSN